MTPPVTHNPVHDAAGHMFGGPQMLWVIAGVPLLALGLYVMYQAVRDSFRRRIRLKTRADTDPLERDAAAGAMDDMQKHHH